jgi:hypothetical protein
MATLREVFGIHNPAPLLTYVDRSSLDDRLAYFLKTGRHLVIHGPSKQGKTALRKRAIPDDECLVIHCRQRPTIQALYGEILAALGVRIPTTQTSSSKKEVSGSTEMAAKGGFFSFISGEAKAEGEARTSWENDISELVIGKETGNIHFLAEAIRASHKRVILEDFHYIPEPEKKLLANDLKALFELEVPVVLVGAWEQDQLLPQYNGDLSGRVDEINLRWSDRELREVLEKGQKALNIRLSRELKDAIVSDASGNVGLLQRIVEKLCIFADVLMTQTGGPKQIRRLELLNSSRQCICKEEAARYRAFGWSVCEGFANSNQATKQLYMYLIQVCVEATDSELVAGLPLTLVEERIRRLNPDVLVKSVRSALQQIDKLQSDKSIYPVIATYDPVNRVVNLADRELLFYRKYGGPDWPWEDRHE